MARKQRTDARPIVWVIGFLVVATVAYFAMLGTRGVRLVATGNPPAVGLGLGVLLLPILGAWLLYSTLRAGLEHQRLARAVAEQGRELDVSQLPRRASGRIEREAADELFAQVKAEWEENPGEWQRTYRIARAYDYAGDRTRARQMMKRAVEQYQQAQNPEQEAA